MRPHVELIQEDDYVWHPAELPGGEGRASERRLSVDEEDGSSSLRVDFHTAWGRGPGTHHADTEFYVLTGEMTYGDRTLGKGGYVYAPKGVPTDAITFAEGTQILHYREYGDAGFDPVNSPEAPRWEDARQDVLVIDSDAMQWEAVADPGPMPGLYIKHLHVDPVTEFCTQLLHAQAGWSDHRLTHHPCFEEAYTTQGRMEYNFGTLDLGTYLFRPAGIKHGHFTSIEGGVTLLIRSDGELQNCYTQNEWVRWGGEGLNYGSADGQFPVRWSQSSHDLAQPWRSDEALAMLQSAWQFQKDQGALDDPVLPHGEGSDKSMIAIAKALDTINIQRGHSTHAHGHSHGDHSHNEPTIHLDWGLDLRSVEHSDERTGESGHNEARGHARKPGGHAPAPILSSLPVRSRSRGRWDGDGM